MLYSLKSKMVVTFSFLLVVPFISMVYIFTEQSKNSVEDIAITVSSQTLDQYAEYLDMLGRQVEELAFQVLGNEEVQRWVAARGQSFADEHTRQEMLLLNARVKDVLAQAVLSQSSVASISLHDRTGFVIGTDSVYEHVQYKGMDWYSHIIEHGPGWIHSHSDPYQPYTLQRIPVNSLVFPLVDLNTLSVEGAIKLNVYSSLIQEPLSRIQYNEWNSILLVNASGEHVVPSPNDSSLVLSGSEFQEQILQSTATKGLLKKVEDDGAVRYWFYRKVKSTDWVLIGVVAEEELFRSIQKTSQTMHGIGVGLLLLTIAAAYWISSSMTRPLSKLSSAMRLLEKGDFNIAERLNVTARGEAGYLLSVFSNMAKRLQQLIHNEFTLKLRKQDAEYKALLMQVNPHFLYNTLEIIGGLAAQNKTEPLIDITESLGQMLRHSLKTDSDLVKLSDEFQQLRHYITVMKCRFEDRIEFELYEDPEVRDVLIVKFILQPLVENAVKYSRNAPHKAFIRVSAVKQERHLLLTVEDNGEGMTEEKRKEIVKEALSQEAVQVLGGPTRRIGLRNVIARCALYYGDRFQFTMESAVGVGTRIELKIPIGGETGHV